MPPIDELVKAATEAQAPDEPGPRQTLAMRLAARNGQRELRAARLARLRAGPVGATGPGRDRDTTFLKVYLRGLADAPTMAAERPAATSKMGHCHGTAAAAAPSTLVTSDLDRLPGIGPGLIRALERTGFRCLADLAPLGSADLVARLGPIGRLVPAATWLAAARAASHDLVARDHSSGR